MSDHIALLAEVHAHVLGVRQIAAETTGQRKRDACQHVANTIEQRARELDEMYLACTGEKTWGVVRTLSQAQEPGASSIQAPKVFWA